MRMYDIIAKKRDGFELTGQELDFFVRGVTDGSIPDYQASALLMAVFFNGMTESETAALTIAMSNSGEKADLSAIRGIKVDKHSTGGVGDKTTLIIAPVVAACGAKVAKMSGRGLGHTGGTIDKLESIPNCKTEISKDDFINIVNKVGAAVIGQSGSFAPADKKLYALRDVTATVESIPLIAASIMSKKLAAGSDCILLDVKTGSGAFMKSAQDAVRLAEVMVNIGEMAGKKTVALISGMDIPLGNAIGNSLEVAEACEILKGRGAADLREVCVSLAANMLYMAQIGTLEHCTQLVNKSISDLSAFNKLKEIISAQGGDVSVLDDYSKFPQAKCSYSVKSPRSGYIYSMNAEKCGTASMLLGAGRETKLSVIDYSAGIILKAKTGDYANKGDELAVFYTNKPESLAQAEELFLSAIAFDDKKPEIPPHILAKVEKGKTQHYV